MAPLPSAAPRPWSVEMPPDWRLVLVAGFILSTGSPLPASYGLYTSVTNANFSFVCFVAVIVVAVVVAVVVVVQPAVRALRNE